MYHATIPVVLTAADYRRPDATGIKTALREPLYA